MTKVIECHGLTKEFDHLEPSSRTSASGMWVPYLIGLLRKDRGRNPYARRKETLIAVDGLSLEVGEGELFGLLGPNGAGKTTLLKILATLLLPTKGHASVNGYDVIHESNQVRRSISVIASSGWLGFDMQLSVEQNLAYWATLYGCPPRRVNSRVRHVLELVALRDRAGESPSVLSSGMRQRLAIAKGLLMDTPIFFMDEPTSALDPQIANDVQDFIRQTVNQENHSTILLTTHNIQEAELLCDRVAFLKKGKIVACGSPQTLKQAMTSRIMRVEAVGLSLNVIQQLRNSFRILRARHNINPQNAGGWCRFHIADKFTYPAEVKGFMEKEGIDSPSVEYVEPTLEDVYFAVTGTESVSYANS